MSGAFALLRSDSQCFPAAVVPLYFSLCLYRFVVLFCFSIALVLLSFVVAGSCLQDGNTRMGSIRLIGDVREAKFREKEKKEKIAL